QNINDHDKAITDFTAAIQINPKNIDAFRARGDSQMHMGEKAKAEADFAQARQLGYEAKPSGAVTSVLSSVKSWWSRR
ncbi:MAG: hypothetical protein U1E05_14250, partial [Patescibacteria group bacterium]|nr:hypothetical protein [Patescibacteria group bacterium]